MATGRFGPFRKKEAGFVRVRLDSTISRKTRDELAACSSLSRIDPPNMTGPGNQFTRTDEWRAKPGCVLLASALRIAVRPALKDITMALPLISRRRSDSSARRAHNRRRQMLVEGLETRELLSTFGVSSSQDSGDGSLRQAIINSNSTPATAANPNVISFAGLHNITQIQLQSQLPTITQPVIIDGTTESSYNGNHPFVQLLGDTAGSALGLDIAASGTQVKALAIDAFANGGVLIDNASNVTLTGDYIGINPNNNASGTDANLNQIYEGNVIYGVTIQSENGGSATGNVLSNDIVSANVYNGIILSGLATTKNVVQGTIIGSDNTGSAVVDDPGNPLGNGQHGGGGSGIVINLGASANTIGGTTTSARDVILGNKSYGVYITDSGTNNNVIEGNVIGTDITGMHATDGAGRSYGNGQSGVAIVMGAENNIVSGTSTAPEVISANAQDGVYISGSMTSSNIVEGVNIGTDITGEAALPNALDGVAIANAATDNFVGVSSSSPNIISGNTGNGVSITGFDTDQNFIENSLIGIDAGGVTSLGNGNNGVLVNGQATNNFIGYPSSNSGNVISGNKTWGVYISDSGTTDNLVAGNLIGTNVTGNYPVPNNNNGLDIVFGATNNTVGGTTRAARNVISGNLHEGVLIGFSGTTGNLVEGNFLGTDISGKNALPNSQQIDGVYVGLGAGSNTIGGQNPVGALNTAAWNVISGNTSSGILVTDSGTTGEVICGNFLGTDVTGTVSIPNGGNGVTIAAGTSNTTIGAETSGSGNLNVISGNLNDGISITSSSGTNVSFNYLGVDLNNQNALPNGGNGVSIHSASGNRVNLDVLKNNKGYGILTDTGASQNAWYYDSIFANGAGGIAQVTNPTLQPVPVITNYVVGSNGIALLTGTISGSPDHNASLVIQFYANPATSSPAGAQGLTFLGQTSSSTDGNGNATFVYNLSKTLAPGESLTATADFAVTNTSNLSAPYAITGTQALGDAGFEAPALDTGNFQYRPTGTIWTFAGSSGIAANQSGFTGGNPNAPEGTQVGFLQSTSSISQPILISGGSYQISFKAAQRAGNHQNINVLVDGNSVGSFTPAGSSYATLSTDTFTLSPGAHTVTFQGLDSAGGDNTAFIDAVNVAPVAPLIANAGFESPAVGNGSSIVQQGQAGPSRGTRESQGTTAPSRGAIPPHHRVLRSPSFKPRELSARRSPAGRPAATRSPSRQRSGPATTRTSSFWSTATPLAASRQRDPATLPTPRPHSRSVLARTPLPSRVWTVWEATTRPSSMRSRSRQPPWVSISWTSRRTPFSARPSSPV
jgi:hypothetical protein